MSTIPPPASVARYVRILGEDLALRFFLEFGGASRKLAASPRDSEVFLLVGEAAAVALYEEFGLEINRVPLAKVWIAQVLHARGAPVQEIARTLHVTNKAVRSWTREGRGEARRLAEERSERRVAEKARQGDLIDWLEAHGER